MTNIGIFDSGFGGISVLNCCLHHMPDENYIYFADSINAPFGTKNKKELLSIGSNIIEKLLTYNPKSIIIACGTMSTNIITELKNKYPNIDLIGTYPTFDKIFKKGFVASEQKLSYSKEYGLEIKRRTKKILIIATSATCKSDFVAELRDSYSDLLDIYIEPADFIVKAVEKNETMTYSFKNQLYELFKEYKDIDYLVLGCTHFPFAEASIREVLGDKVNIISGCENAAIDCKTLIYGDDNDVNDNSPEDLKEIKVIDTNLTDDRINIYRNLLNVNMSKYNITFSKN